MFGRISHWTVQLTLICHKIQGALLGVLLKDGAIWAANAACAGNLHGGALIWPLVVLALLQQLSHHLAVISDVLYLYWQPGQPLVDTTHHSRLM